MKKVVTLTESELKEIIGSAVLEVKKSFASALDNGMETFGEPGKSVSYSPIKNSNGQVIGVNSSFSNSYFK